MKILSLAAVTTAVLLSGCNSSSQSKSTSQPTIGIASQVHGISIEAVPSQFSDYSKAGYNRYVAVKAPNRKSIHILIMDRLSEYQIVKAVNVLNHYLTPVAGTKYGDKDSKRDIANAMANNGAILKLMNYHDEPRYNDDLDGQPLFEEEIQVEGGDWYVRQDYEDHRDASYEEILHLVHDYGIGVLNAPEGGVTALPEFQREFNTIQKQALNQSYTPPEDTLKEWQQEVSVDQEYFAAIIDSYYGLWGAYSGKGMWDLYSVKTRSDFSTEDPNALYITEQIFSPTLTYDAYIADTFTGTFKMRYDAIVPYTHHSQYLTKLTLTGSKDTNIELNGHDNRLTGNTGINTVIVHGARSEYHIHDLGEGKIQLNDMRTDRDGMNVLINIEKIQFSDELWEL
ncbi:hypothetical protein F2Z80_23410 [Vibrio fortis]|uniref:Lipoprotein n=1 Tax=Vibrio fortis TaxID=212667 RepID=A0A5N3RZN5_9VIBR|nr:hypothetical protein [Vibrio fortis]KAB0300068.1 hypothetical protein F2Z80_23410 [Vibrio fortis]